MNLNKIKTRTGLILQEFEETRNDDNTLLSEYYKKYEPENCIIDTKGVAIFLEETKASMKAITRCRRAIQEKGNFLPTDPDVAIKRRMSKEMFKIHFGK